MPGIVKVLNLLRRDMGLTISSYRKPWPLRALCAKSPHRFPITSLDAVFRTTPARAHQFGQEAAVSSPFHYSSLLLPPDSDVVVSRNECTELRTLYVILSLFSSTSPVSNGFSIDPYVGFAHALFFASSISHLVV